MYIRFTLGGGRGASARTAPQSTGLVTTFKQNNRHYKLQAIGLQSKFNLYSTKQLRVTTHLQVTAF